MTATPTPLEQQSITQIVPLLSYETTSPAFLPIDGIDTSGWGYAVLLINNLPGEMSASKTVSIRLQEKENESDDFAPAVLDPGEFLSDGTTTAGYYWCVWNLQNVARLIRFRVAVSGVTGGDGLSFSAHLILWGKNAPSAESIENALDTYGNP